MIQYRLVSDQQADADVEAAFGWYETEQAGLGIEFLDALRATFQRIVQGPLHYQDLRSGIRRALVRRFPYAVYFAVNREVVVILAVLHVGRDPEAWQLRSI